ncbi:hypothetical protein B0T16DRAFT_496779 [Cercophora newfieldiana]|uniref:Nephrocystin 3-like N-terminal domain-containing protein n=1 Tax=Cercophora newfieldiana TaxID=92897 RepID=A0AA39XQR2_9PEZI|nr:hypothetical protein B0T16DRAFT_496779 [Cercophora newfieldiana]
MASDSAAVAPDWRRTVFRLSRIPNGATTTSAVAALVAKALQVPTKSVKVYSLATTLTPWEMPPSRVATLMLLQNPVLLGSSQDGRNEWALEPGRHESLVLDTHFWGLTPLNDVASDNHIADCVAISGLASHAFGSWQPHGNDKTFMWIRDQLPKSVPGVRAILYGYESKLAGSESFQSIQDLALGLISQIRANGGALDNAKPLVFLAHSLGGIVLKDALCKLANSQDNSLERKILARCRGAIMFGVPNLGMEQDHLLAIVRGGSTEQLVRDLSRRSGISGYLDRLERSFSGIAAIGEMTFYWVFETSKSPTFDSKVGKMTGPHSILVDPDSATKHRVSESPSSVHPIARNHSDMVKFTRNDPNTGAIIELTRRVCGLAEVDAEDEGAKIPHNAAEQLNLVVPNGRLEDHGSDEERRQRLLEGFLDSLHAVGLDHRQALIADRFEKTCEWVYKRKRFISWLRQDHGVFWIHGKPGSGKSTLMKLIYTDRRTWQYSHTFGRSASHISAGFFFNYRGTSIQKTLEGLMRSILRQIMTRLAETESTIPLLDDLLKRPTFTPRPHDSWPITRLEEALRVILEQKRVELRITFFFDALDEFDGPPDYISRFVKYLASHPTGSSTFTKVCFSSRPWHDFLSNFSNGPNLAVEDFTKEDIRYFCTINLGKSLDESHHKQVRRLADAIVLRASGVFLWASLILKELVAAFDDKTPSLGELLRLLESVPTELSEYYHFIIRRIPENLRWRTYALLEAVVRARSPTELSPAYLWETVLISDSLSYSAARDALGVVGNHSHAEPSEDDSFEERRRDILLWGGGLVSVPQGTNKLSEAPVQLMHQTVYEFVTKLDFKDQVLGPLAKVTHENGHAFHFKSVLTFRLDRELGPQPGADLRLSMNHGAEAEETTGRSCQPFLDSVPSFIIFDLGSRLLRALKFSHKGYLSPLFDDGLIHSHMMFATFFRLRLYLQDCVLHNARYLIAASDDLLRLIIVAIRFGDASMHQQLLSTLSFLLENGYDKNMLIAWRLFPYVLEQELRWHHSDLDCLEVFEHLAIVLLEHEPSCATRRIPVGSSQENWVLPLHLATPMMTCWLLEHGADPNGEDWLSRTAIDYLSVHSLREVQGLTGSAREEVNFRAERFRRLYQSTSLIVRYGGKRGYSSDKSWKSFVAALQNEGFDVSEFPTMLEEQIHTTMAHEEESGEGLLTLSPAWINPQPTGKKPSLFRGMKRLFSKWHKR